MIKRATPLLVVAALAGCGAEASTQESERQTAEDARLRFAECMREQGVDVPDPGEDGAIRIQRAGPGRGPGDVNDERFREAQEKCREHLRDAVPELSEEERQEFQDQALAFARCMREHGIDMPDPEFGDGGRITQRMERPPNVARMREAEKACAKHRPEPPREGP